MKLFPLITIIIGSSLAAHDYFEYDDCGDTCTYQKMCCTISENNGDFITTCCNSEDCMARESDEVVCLRPGSAPTGGETLWPSFRQKVHPSTTTPAPEKPAECEKWKVMLGIGWSLSGLSLIFLMVKFVVKKMKSRQRYQQIVSEDHPYQPTVENIDNTENAETNRQ